MLIEARLSILYSWYELVISTPCSYHTGPSSDSQVEISHRTVIFKPGHSPDPRPQKVYPDCPLILRGKLALDLVNGRVEEKEGEKASLSRRMRWGVIVVSWFSVFMRNFKAIL
jgi:hypothetical protein